YAVSSAQLEPGDALVLYTDGVIDARQEGVFFAEQGLLATVARLAQGSAEEMAAGVREAVLAFADGLRDDLQILVVRRVPAQRT
ncbi:MAG: SpoIIE family protein phosphatase, partial [Thermoleophilia bacterium]